jgi:hypothetical protein
MEGVRSPTCVKFEVCPNVSYNTDQARLTLCYVSPCRPLHDSEGKGSQASRLSLVSDHRRGTSVGRIRVRDGSK